MDRSGKFRTIVWSAIIFAGVVLVGCGGRVDLQKQMSGVWRDRLSHEVVEVHLDGKTKTITLAGHTYNAVVENLDKDKGQIKVKVKNGSNAPEHWLLTQMWVDSDNFDIVLERGKHEKEVLEKRG